jgi:polysaccharide export outer membrane protein
MRSAWLVVCLLVILGAARGQEPRTAADSGANLPAQRIGPNDLISVSVYGSPELTRTIRVGPDGFIRLPMLKQRIQADKLLPAEVESAIIEALQSEELLVEPVVTVTIAEYHSRPISVAGAVRDPITFQAIGPVTLLDALARSGGLRSDAGAEILVSRVQMADDGMPTALVQRIPVRALIDAADPDMNLKLTGGEEIRVPEVGKIYVAGSVKKPGAFPIQSSAETTVLQILALAEGLAPFASKQAYVYRQEAANGAKHEIRIELSKILGRKAPDVSLQPNDILYIPDNTGRRVTVSALERIAGFGTSTASGLLVWRR